MGDTDDVVLPAQFFSTLIDPRTEPERRLMVAVLEEAISAVLSGANAGGEERRAAALEAERWFASNSRSWPFAFCTLCDVLGLDIDRVRDVIGVWRQRQRSFRRPRLQAGRGRHQVQTPGRRPRRAA
ncbi:MAG TPA: hypothetical protein VL049_06930 [Candidatus Dormibacteraeota bacterium]|nr:hypothetical protein [Candidatus Dormibacteraeota bacterium]